MMKCIQVVSPAETLSLAQGRGPASEPVLLSKVPTSELMARLGRIRHACLDFDHTMTVDTHTWPHCAARLRPKDQPFEKEYVGWAFQGTGTFYGVHDDDMPLIDRKRETALDRAIWATAAASRTITLMAREGATRETFRDIAKCLKLREGTSELIRAMDGTSVVSWGLKPTIEECLALHGLSADVISTTLLFDDKDRLIGLHPGDVVVGENKGVKAGRYRRAKRLKSAEILSIGDSVHDYSMMPRNGGVNLLIIPQSEANNASRTFHDSHIGGLWRVLTGVLVSDSFLPLVELLRKSVTKKGV